MPANRPSLTALSARLTTLAVDVQRAVDQLLAEPMNDVEFARHLTAPVVLLQRPRSAQGRHLQCGDA
jgi:hypothetical protein